MTRRLVVALGVMFSVMVLAAATATTGRGAAPAGPPNIVVITTDDQTFASLNERVMPNVVRLLAKRGTTFADAVVSTPLCCPSRASWLTGEYAHNHGVTDNDPGYAQLREPDNVLPAWLHASGYRTAHVGKFLNGYRGPDGAAEPAPGWDLWYSLLEPRRYYDYDLSINGRRRHFGTSNADYITRVLNARAASVIERYAAGDRPLFLQLDNYAVHNGVPDRTGRCPPRAPVPDRSDRFLVGDGKAPRPPSFNEADMSDKPLFLRSRASLTRQKIAETDRRYRCKLAALAAVDRGVKQIVQALRDSGTLDRTVILFTSDQGFFFGEHRLVATKVVPYEEGLHVPLVIRVPEGLNGGAKPAGTAGELVANIDIAPTLLDFAGAAPCRADGDCRVLDGRSLRPLIRGDSSEWPGSRGVLIEYRRTRKRFGDLHRPCAYAGVRTVDELYVTYTSAPRGRRGVCRPADATEQYELQRDPFQLRNDYPSATSDELAAQTAELSDCRGVQGRDPAPPNGRPYCQ